VTGVLVILITAFFCGCQDSDIQAATSDNVKLESEVVKLFNSSFTQLYTNRDILYRVEVFFVLENIAGRELQNLIIYCEFYDNDDNLIARSADKQYNNLPKDYIEQTTGEFNMFAYEGQGVELIEYAVLYAYESS
jgi:hypothetical protein